MTFTMTIKMDNSAFCGTDQSDGESRDGYELAKILRRCAGMVDGETIKAGWSQPFMDSNGNRVGRAEIE